VGVEVNPAAGEFAPLGTLFLLTETESRPALFLGTSSDRIGSPEGKQAVYLTATKFLHGTPFGPYATVHYSGWDEQVNLPFGLLVDLGRGFSLTPMYDGERSHLTGGYATEHGTVSLLWIWMERAGVSVSVGF
jgi:hypothetical protein